jgi:hypothetical protein
MASDVTGAISVYYLLARCRHFAVLMGASVALLFLASAEVGGEGVSLRN